jgi:hypothetical protein
MVTCDLRSNGSASAVQLRSCGICGGQSVIGAIFFPEYFGFSFQLSFHRLLKNHHSLSSATGKVGPIVADLPRHLGVTLPTTAEETT